MGTLECVPLRSEIALRGFDCGNASINEKVRKSFYPHLLKQSRTYQIKMQNQTVGFYSLSVMSVNLAQSDASTQSFIPTGRGLVRSAWIILLWMQEFKTMESDPPF